MSDDQFHDPTIESFLNQQPPESRPTDGPSPGFPKDQGIYALQQIGGEGKPCHGRYMVTHEVDYTYVETRPQITSNHAKWRFHWISSGSDRLNQEIYQIQNCETSTWLYVIRGEDFLRTTLDRNQSPYLNVIKSRTSDDLLIGSFGDYYIGIEANCVHAILRWIGEGKPPNDYLVWKAIEQTL